MLPVVKRTLVAALVLGLCRPAVSVAHPLEDCTPELARLGLEGLKEKSPRTWRSLTFVLKTGAKITVLPFYLPMKATFEIWDRPGQILRLPFKMVREDGVAMLGYLVLFAVGNTPFEALIQLGPVTSHDGIDEEAWEGEGPIVGINGVSASQSYPKLSKYVSGATRTDGKTKFQIDSSEPKGMFESLLALYKKTGPLRRAVIVAHGVPGGVMIGDTFFNGKWVEENRAYLNSLPADLFAPGAEIRLISCSTAAPAPDQQAGKDSVAALFSPVLKQGGTVVAANRHVFPNFGKVPADLRWSDEHVQAALESIVFSPTLINQFLSLDPGVRAEPVVRIRVPPRP